MLQRIHHAFTSASKSKKPTKWQLHQPAGRPASHRGAATKAMAAALAAELLAEEESEKREEKPMPDS